MGDRVHRKIAFERAIVDRPKDTKQIYYFCKFPLFYQNSWLPLSKIYSL